MKQYNCPDCKVKEDSCDGCQRYCDSIKSNANEIHTDKEISLSDWDWLQKSISEYDFPKTSLGDYKCCENCMNNPKNNPMASGMCNCALPYLTTTSW